MGRLTDNTPRAWAGVLLLCAAGAGCKGKDGPTGLPGGSGTAPTPTVVARGDDPPGITITVVALSGGTGPKGSFRVGDRISVRFTIEKDDGSPWDLSEMVLGRALVSGPTFNYNRVIPEATDVLTASVRHADGSYSYTFASPIPSVYAAPYNDSPAFGPGDGELTGQPLLDGTYTVGLYTRWDYTVDGESARDAGNATADFLYGGAITLAPRDVVTQENCNRCHSDLRAHGGMRKDVTLCLLCHTSGSEDRNAGGATPGESVDFRVMIHKIHNGSYLPSVLGVGTLADGSRDYTVAKKPYVLVGFTTVDFSHVGFPVMPNLTIPLPRDTGYGTLGPTEQELEDRMRSGAADCGVCHGDPDGAGPLPPPAQGGLILSQPTRRACGSCHDDVDWDLPYVANEQKMPPQPNDALCIFCHPATGDELAVIDGHRHPLLDPLVNPGLEFEVTAVEEGTGANMNGDVEVGERVRVTLTIRDDLGNDVDPADLASRSLVISGPTSNANLLLNTSLPSEVLAGPQPFVFDVPESLVLEFVGDSDPGTGGEVFTTLRSPHWNGPSSATVVYARAPTSGGTALADAAPADQNFVDVGTAAGFQVDDVVVVDEGAGTEEYLRVQWVDGDRLWFASPYQSGYQPGLRFDHGAGASVRVADLTMLTPGADYVLDPGLGTITETSELGDVAVVVSYTSDFLVPPTYDLALNDSPDLDETDGQWTGKSVVDGTYTLNVWGHRDLSVDVVGEITAYRGASEAGSFDFLIGTTAVLEPYDLIESAASCNECHQDLYFHGGSRRGFETCLACHGLAAAEDRPRYRASGAPETTGVQVGFRELLHKIHMGGELTNAATYEVVGFGPGGPPGNFSTHSYEDVVFPTQPGAASDCVSCHGASEAWTAPGDRDHPSEQFLPARAWSVACNACHDSAAATEHIDSNVSRGGESCSVCHGAGKPLGVERVHESY